MIHTETRGNLRRQHMQQRINGPFSGKPGLAHSIQFYPPLLPKEDRLR